MHSSASPDRPHLRIFILEGYEPARQGLQEQLEANEFDVVGSCSSAQEAAPLILALHPDVAILVVRLEDGSGLDVLRTVHAADGSQHCLMLDTIPDPGVRRSAEAAGANGYLLKQIDGQALSDALYRAAAGGFVFAA